MTYSRPEQMDSTDSTKSHNQITNHPISFDHNTLQIIRKLDNMSRVKSPQDPLIIDNMPRLKSPQDPWIIDNMPRLKSHQDPWIIDNMPRLKSPQDPWIIDNMPRVSPDSPVMPDIQKWSYYRPEQLKKAFPEIPGPLQTKERIKAEVEELRGHLNATAKHAVLRIPDPFQSLLRRINTHGDAYSVYRQLNPDERDKVLLTLDIDSNGKIVYKLSGKQAH